MDRMTFPEIECLIENLWMKNKESWEQTRMIGYITAQVQSTKPLEIKQIMTFPWEASLGDMKQTDTEEERQKIMEEMKKMEYKLNNNI